MYGITCVVTLKENTFDWNKIKQKKKKHKQPPPKKQTKNLCDSYKN